MYIITCKCIQYYKNKYEKVKVRIKLTFRKSVLEKLDRLSFNSTQNLKKGLCLEMYKIYIVHFKIRCTFVNVQ